MIEPARHTAGVGHRRAQHRPGDVEFGGVAGGKFGGPRGGQTAA